MFSRCSRSTLRHFSRSGRRPDRPRPQGGPGPVFHLLWQRQCPLLAKNGLSGHVAGTSALPPTAEVRAPMSGIRVFMSGSPPASDVPGTLCHPKRPVRPCRGGRRRRRGRVCAPFRCSQQTAPIIDFRFLRFSYARARAEKDNSLRPSRRFAELAAGACYGLGPLARHQRVACANARPLSVASRACL